MPYHELLMQFKTIPHMCQDQNVRLLIMDRSELKLFVDLCIGMTLIVIYNSVAGLVRSEFDTTTVGHMLARTNALFTIAAQLKRLCDAYKLCIVVVNQVNSSCMHFSIQSLHRSYY